MLEKFLLTNFLLQIQEYSQTQDVVGYFSQHDLMNTTTPWQSFGHAEISPSSSYSNFNGETEFSDALMSPYSGQGIFMDLCVNEDMAYEYYDQINSISDPKQF